MTFKIVDGREHFYQWDLNRQIIVDDPAIKEVHFCNRMDNCSLVVEVENGIANVPNILLQNGFDIRVFAYDGHATLFDKVFEVKARTRPSDYVYTETEVKRLEDVEEKLFKEINERLEEIEGGLITDGFATKEYVDEAVSNVSVDLTGYAKESYVDSAITQSVSGLAKKEDIPDVSKFITSIPSEYITESELNSKGYLTQHQSLNHKADKNHTHSYNDLTNKPTIPSIAGLATESYVDNAIKNIEIPEVDLSNCYEKVDNVVITNEAPDKELIVLTTNVDCLPNRDASEQSGYLIFKDSYGGFDNVLTRGTAYGREAIYTKGAGGDVYTLTLPRYETGTLATQGYVNEAIANIEIPEAGVGIVYVDNSTTGEELAALLEAGNLPIYNHSLSGFTLPLSRVNTKANETEYIFSSASHSSTGSVITVVRCIVTSDSTTWSEAPSSRGLQDPIYANNGVGTKDLTSISIDGTTYNIPEADLSNYYTKEETEAAIQSALNAIGVAEGGAY